MRASFALYFSRTFQKGCVFFFGLGLALLLSACATTTSGTQQAWRVRDMAQAQTPKVRLLGPHEQIMATLSTLTIKKLMLAHLRITRAAGVHAELLIVDGNDPNAFAGPFQQQQVIAINIGMLKLVGDDIDEFAALLGHEAAHLAKKHAEANESRSKTFDAIGTLAALGLQSAGVPAAGTIAGMGVQLIDASYSRDQEREADALGVGYAMEAKYDPEGALRLHEKILKVSGGSLLPFLSSHPSSQERIDNLKEIIQTKKSGNPLYDSTPNSKSDEVPIREPDLSR